MTDLNPVKKLREAAGDLWRVESVKFHGTPEHRIEAETALLEFRNNGVVFSGTDTEQARLIRSEDVVEVIDNNTGRLIMSDFFNDSQQGLILKFIDGDEETSFLFSAKDANIIIWSIEKVQKDQEERDKRKDDSQINLEKLITLSKLKDMGVITEEEFEQKKTELLKKV